MVALSEFKGSARKVPLQTMQRRVLQDRGITIDEPVVEKNHFQLYSFYKPGLLAGEYAIEAVQTITSQNPPNTAHPDKGAQEQYQVYNRRNIYNTDGTEKPARLDRTKPDPTVWPQDSSQHDEYAPQIFKVVAPQFSLDTKLIDTYYPPDGHHDECRILPHIVLNDKHFPWERAADRLLNELYDPDRDQSGAIIDVNGSVISDPVTDKKKIVMRNCLPWVALMTCDYEDLPPLGFNGEDISYLNLPSTLNLQKQPSSGAFQMEVGQYLKIPAAYRVDYKTPLQNADDLDAWDDIFASTEKMTAIFPTKQRFLELFPDITTLRYAAHVRNINTADCPDAGIQEVGYFSVILASRLANYKATGAGSTPPEKQKPVTQICHLISIENFEQTKQNILKELNALPSTETTGRNKILSQRIGLVSLFTWTYLALPPNPVTFIDSIVNVLQGIQYLRPDKEKVLGQVKKASEDPNKSLDDRKALSAMHDRLQAGYTIARWRAETGEGTAAFQRGPLVPVVTKWPPVTDWPTRSNTSKDYQILDTTTGMMDLSYSSAWQLGKTLAISDTSFSGALARLRSTIQKWAASKTRAQVNGMTSQRRLLANLANSVNGLDQIIAGQGSSPTRVSAPTQRELRTALDDPVVVPVLRANISAAVTEAGSTVGGELWTEFSPSGENNTDFTIVHTWISEKLSLADIPAHFLIPDPSFLPEESIRFFHIDDSWMDCLIDGALSVANHLEQDGDMVRDAIKNTYNAYLKDTNSMPHPPLVPRFGFILRSQIVKVVPDMRITIQWGKDDANGEAVYCRYTRPDDHTILCLLHRPPEDLDWIQLQQPAHQQRFAFGQALLLEPEIINGQPSTDPNDVEWHAEVRMREMFTSTNMSEKPWGLNAGIEDETMVDKWWDTNTRIIDFSKVAPDVNRRVRELVGTDTSDPNKPSYIDFVPNSAELAMQLNDPCFYFRIVRHNPDPVSNPMKITPRNRQLWCASQIEIKNPDKPIETNPPDTTPIGPAPAPPKPPKLSAAIHVPGLNPVGAPARANKIIMIKNPPNLSPPATTTFRPQFTTLIYPDYKGVPKIWPLDGPFSFDKTNYLPTLNDNLYDLIFSVRKIGGNTNLNLREVVFNIPTTAGGNTRVEPLIDDTRSGPKVRMLSNQRFVPLLNWTPDSLQVRLIPRSAKQHPVIQLKDRRTNVLSFRLEDCYIPKVQLKTKISMHGQLQKEPGLGLVDVQVFERYVSGPVESGVDVTASPVRHVLLVKRDTRDEVVIK